MTIFSKTFLFYSTQLSAFHVSFVDEVVTLKRTETYTITGILAIGGLLALFLGMSLLGIIELVYFATLRLFWNVWRVRKENAVAPMEQRPIA